MKLAAQILVGLVAVEHVYILVLEMFLWETKRGRKAFGTTPEKAATTAELAKNQGLYNGFLAAGCFYGVLAEHFGAGAVEAYHFRIFFTACVVVAGLYGGMTVSRKIIVVQALPAMLALGATLLAGPFN
jgi:putative membrane protein